MRFDNLSRARKIAQLIMPRIDFSIDGALEQAVELVRDYGVGGFIIFRAKRDQLTRATAVLQSLSDTPLLFGCDAERGLGQIVEGCTVFPSAIALSAADDEVLVYSESSSIAREMRECGLNLLFAPVADLNTNPQNPIINVRSYGDDPARVTRMVRSFINGAQDNGVVACAKHFPGHGSVDVDSHEGLPISMRKVDELREIELIPFIEAIECGVGSVMTAHVSFPRVTEGSSPATISGDILTGILRNELGYDGLVITDSLHMEGIKEIGSELVISKQAIYAGCDIILDPESPCELIDHLSNSLLSGEYREEDLDKSLARIKGAKEFICSYEYMDDAQNDKTALSLSNEISERSICQVRGSSLEAKVCSAYIFDMTGSTNISNDFVEGLVDRELSLELIHVTGDNVTGLMMKPPDQPIICLVYTAIGAWKKQFQLTPEYADLLKNLSRSESESVLISFGNPYVVAPFSGFDTVIVVFDSLGSCQRAAVEVLLGNKTATGVMPVKLG